MFTNPCCSFDQTHCSLATHMFAWGRYWHECIQAPFNQRCITFISCLGRNLHVWFLQMHIGLQREPFKILPSWQRHNISIWSFSIIICSRFKLTCWYGNGAFWNVIHEWLRAQGSCMLLWITWGRWHWNINMSTPSLHLCVIYQIVIFCRKENIGSYTNLYLSDNIKYYTWFLYSCTSKHTQLFLDILLQRTEQVGSGGPFICFGDVISSHINYRLL